jgi:hypothetical protein
MPLNNNNIITITITTSPAERMSKEGSLLDV